MGQVFGMKISGSGIASNGMRSIQRRREMWQARAAISCLHDALLAVAKGQVTPDQIRDFFWSSDIEMAKPYGDVIKFEGGK